MHSLSLFRLDPWFYSDSNFANLGALIRRGQAGNDALTRKNHRKANHNSILKITSFIHLRTLPRSSPPLVPHAPGGQVFSLPIAPAIPGDRDALLRSFLLSGVLKDKHPIPPSDLPASLFSYLLSGWHLRSTLRELCSWIQTKRSKSLSRIPGDCPDVK
ncbi:hypothetical protein AFLA_008907 [Aspergillus flavus NRRL3357]|nr:hypothetical protein AFLA_008907 [Aspergillus flavus NRRL3357]